MVQGSSYELAESISWRRIDTFELGGAVRTGPDGAIPSAGRDRPSCGRDDARARRCRGGTACRVVLRRRAHAVHTGWRGLGARWSADGHVQVLDLALVLGGLLGVQREGDRLG